ncbi:MAG: hypothetical protein HY738_18495 [Bacteroidia bacterium]|nr:hypothetical protein [Bacteroidia bacterium]
MVQDPGYVYATFKSTRLLNGHSIERMQKYDLDVRISHRFGKINKGPYEFFGLDQNVSYFGLEYGLFDWLMAGTGRSSYKKMYNGFVKLSILLCYTHQLPCARKFTQWLSFQISPVFIHRNLVAANEDKNDILAFGAGGRIKITSRISFNFEYYYLLNNPVASSPCYDPFAIGFDIETGGHVFQILYFL